VFRHRLPEAASWLTHHGSTVQPPHAQSSFGHLFRNSEHASTARPEGVLELGRVGFCPGSKLRMRYRKNLTGEIRLQSRHTRAKRAFITRWIPPVKPIQRAGNSALPHRQKNRFSSPFRALCIAQRILREIVLPRFPVMGPRSWRQMLCEIPSRFACGSSRLSAPPGIRTAATWPPGTLENLFAYTPEEIHPNQDAFEFAYFRLPSEAPYMASNRSCEWPS
jgi:hypothetical protein